MGMNRGGIEGSLVELKEEDESRRHTLTNSGSKLFAQKKKKQKKKQLKHYTIL